MNKVNIVKKDPESTIIDGHRILSWDEIPAFFEVFMTTSDTDFGWRTVNNDSLVWERIEGVLSAFSVGKGNAFTEDVIFPQQVHGGIVRDVKEEKVHKYGRCYYVPQCDGLITDDDSVYIASQYADCTPVLVLDTKNYTMGVFHSGWRGTVSRIAETGIRKMINEYDCHPSDMKCYLFNGIGMDDFEVDEEVYHEFVKEFYTKKKILQGEQGQNIDEQKSLNYEMLTTNADYESNENEIFHPSKWSYKKGDKYHIDTHYINSQTIASLGIDVIMSATSTYSDRKFHSYRRDGAKSGRMLVIAKINKMDKT